jgi:hypothetical protein
MGGLAALVKKKCEAIEVDVSGAGRQIILPPALFRHERAIKRSDWAHDGDVEVRKSHNNPLIEKMLCGRCDRVTTCGLCIQKPRSTHKSRRGF